MSLTLSETLRLMMPDGTVKTVLVEDYLRGVVAAALPADAPLEAMKALAVAARTFAAHTHRHLDRSADLCTTRHCQQWSERANPRAARAVIETRSIVATHDDKFIEAFYFEHCDGKTRDAAGVLVNAPAYLKSVLCPCGFASIKGHGIGMCRRGMVAMARFGENYDYILRHYYSGISLERLGIDETTRGKIPITPPKRQPAPAKRTPSPRVRPTAPPPSPVDTTPPATPAAPASTGKPLTEKPARKTPVPRRVPRPTAEKMSTDDARRTTVEKSTALPTKQPTNPPDSKPPQRLTDHKPEAEEADDFVSFIAVDDIAPAHDERRTTGESTGAQPAHEPTVPPANQPTDHTPLALDAAFALAMEHDAPPLPPQDLFLTQPPPASMPEDFPEPVTPPSVTTAPPPMSMPEELPTALELEFIAAPTGAPEDLHADFVAPPTMTSIEPDFDAFIPPVEKFYTPLDAPESMPEGLPSFSTERADETPIAWVPPPPLFETEANAHQPKILMDYLPGPRIIAGNLPRSGMLITVRDAAGNSLVTVSGVAKHYGAGGFEAPLTDDGAYHVKFDGAELDVKLENETVFIYYQ